MNKLCKICGLEFKKDYYRSRRSWALARYCSMLCYGKSKTGTKRSDSERLAISLGQIGHPNYYKGNGTTKRTRKGREFVEWRTAVFERDDYICRNCNVRGVELNAHHVKSWSHFPDLRFDVSNGMTLCVPCHSLTPNYKKRTKLDNF